ncbi:hypothetical protein PS2_044689 [Malus domestica]
MRRRTTTATAAATATAALCDGMLQHLYSHSPHRPSIKQVPSLHTFFSLLTTRRQFSCLTDPSPPPSPPTPDNKTHIDLSSVCFSGIAQSVFSRSSQFFDKNKGRDFANASLKDLLLEIYDVVPEYARRIRRVSELKPEDVLGLLLGFRFQCGRVGFEVRKVESLWEIFKWVSGQSKGFKHFSESYVVMASMLIRVGLLREVEFLLSTMENQEIVLSSNEVFSDLIERYVNAGESERAISMYDRMRRHLVPSLSCYDAFLDHLVQMKKTKLAFRVCWDMVELGVDLRGLKEGTVEKIIGLLCRDGKIQEARNLVKKAMAFELRPSNSVLYEITCGYCEKKDFDDLLSFYAEIKCAPDVLAGNRIMHSLCSSIGTGRSELYMRELEHLGFSPDELTFGIMIGWSCRERKLKNAFIYLSNMLARQLKPHKYTYNALISGVFMGDMWKHAGEIFDEMVDRGVTPNLSTFRILLAGYCKARQFDEAKRVVFDMAGHGLVQNSSVEDPLSKAFTILGFDPLAVRLKRDNDVGFSTTEFYDSLGNGLYLDTDLGEYEKRVTEILEDCLVPNYNSLTMKECALGNFKCALMLVHEMVQWGQELSFSTFSALLKGLSASPSHIKGIANIVDKKLHLVNQLDEEIPNFIVQAYIKKGLTSDGWRMLNEMFQRHLKINNETYTAVIKGLCRRGNLKELHVCWDFAQHDRWLPGFEDCKSLIECLCKKEMITKTVQLLESMLISFPHSRLDICHMFIENLSIQGFTRTAHVLLEELEQRGGILDRMAYRYLIRGLCKEREFHVAFTILDNMLARNLVPCSDVLVLLIPQLCRAGRYEKAIYLKEIGLKEKSYSPLTIDRALFEGCCITGKVGEATALIQSMVLKGLHPDAEVYNILVQGHCKINNLKKVRELLGIMIRNSFSISFSTFRNLVRLMCVEGRVLHLLSLKELMIGQSECHGLTIHNIMIFYLFQTGNALLVNKMVDHLQEEKLRLDEVTYNFLVYGFSRCKDVSSAVDHLCTMISKDFRPSNRNLRMVITSLCGIGELEKAVGLCREMELRGWVHDSIIQNAIVEGLLSQGKLEEAEGFLDRMVEKCLVPENINYDNLIKRFCSYGRLSKAVDLLNIVLKKGNLPASTSYDSVISFCCVVNKLDQAMDFLTEILDRNLKPSINTWDILVHSLCRDGKTAEAERLLNSMVCVGEPVTRQIYLSVINRYRSENNLRKASELMQKMQESGFEPDFETHWSLISNLSNSRDKDNTNSGGGFLSRLLSASGFSRNKNS